jgi:NAD(P)-dependent dehydrogenase (short-subunit alcohol dehydrogenase family)
LADRRSAIALAAAAGAAFSGAFVLTRAARRRTAYDFKGKTAVVTGGSRGLGLVVARELASRGARVAICARDEAEIDRAVEDLDSRGADAVGFRCDVTDRADVEAFVAEVERFVGPVDVLVNNAGTIEVGPMEVMTLEDYERAMRTHFWGPLYTTLAVLPSMRERGEGRIVNISSIGGKISVPHLLPYSASKFALVGLSEGLRSALAKEGVVVTTVCPGLMRTGSPRNALFKGKHRAEYAWFAVADSLPVASMSAERAARQIVDACERGDAEIVLSTPAKLAVLFHDLFPETTADLMAAVDGWLLPAAGGIGTSAATGKESESPVTRSPLTLLTDRAAARNNELDAPPS